MAQLLSVAAPVLADMGDHMDYDGGGWFWMMLMMIIGATIVVLLIYLLTRAFYQGELTRGTGAGETPMDIAKRRYAAGEITCEEFEKIKNDL